MLNARQVIFLIAGLLGLTSLLPAKIAFAPGKAGHAAVSLLTAPTRPVQRWLAGDDPDPLDPGLMIDGGGTADTLRADLDVALTELERLRQQNAELTQRLAELGPIRDLLSQHNLDDLRQVTAAVAPGGSAGVINIASGSSDGIAAGQTVVYGTQVVGRVVEPVGPFSASVALVTSVSPSLSVRIVAPAGETPAGSVVPARGFDARVTLDPETGVFISEDLPRRDDVRVGDTVRLADEYSLTEARAFRLGTVVAAEPLRDNPELLQRVTIRPAVELHRLSRVTVLVPPSAEGSGGGR